MLPLNMKSFIPRKLFRIFIQYFLHEKTCLKIVFLFYLKALRRLSKIVLTMNHRPVGKSFVRGTVNVPFGLEKKPWNISPTLFEAVIGTLLMKSV